MDFNDVATGKKGSQSVVIKVEGPTGTMKTASGTASFVNGAGPNLQMNVGLGGNGKKGIVIDSTFVAPKDFGGDFRNTQALENFNNVGVKLKGSIWKLVGPGGTALDNEENYGTASYAFAGAKGTFSNTDAPGLDAKPFFKEATEIWYGTETSQVKFHMYLMFKPHGQKAIWLPVEVLDWNLWMTNQRDSAVVAWPITPNSIGDTNYKGKTVTTLPTWSSVTVTGDAGLKKQ